MAKVSEISKKINDSLPELNEAMIDFELSGAQLGFAAIAERVFTGRTKDINGAALSKYSAAYKKKREAAGLQTKTKDLIFKGDLFSSLQVGISAGKFVVGIVNEDNANIAENIEKQENKKIFQLSDKEREKVIDESKQILFTKLREITKQWF